MGIENLLRKGYSGKKIFLTGHTGFKGSWLVAILNFLGAEVKGYSLAPAETSLYNLIDGNKICNSVLADILDEKELEHEIKKFQPDYIFHLAAQSLVRESYKDPIYSFRVNSIGSANLLNCIRNLNNPCTIVVVTTDKVYENREMAYSYQENDPLGGYDPYSASKACAEIIISSFRRSYFNLQSYNVHKKAIATARAGNVIGGGDFANDRIIPDIINSLIQNKPVIVRNPDAVRPWQHVLDGLTGYLLLGIKLFENPKQYSEAWNFGPVKNDTLPVKKLVEKALKTWGNGIYECVTVADQPHEAGILQLDSQKSVKQINWNPRLDSSTGIALTMDWYKEVLLLKRSALDVTMDQIKNHLSKE